MTVMAPAKIRYRLKVETGEETGRPIYVVTDTLTGRTRLVSNDADEAADFTKALNEGQHLLVSEIENCLPPTTPVKYDGAV